MSHQSVAKIISWNTDNDAVCASAAKMSTTKGNANEIFEKTKGNPQNTELIKKVMSSGHKSVIEHAVFSIAFWDVSAFVEQYLIECRLASFTVKSRRYVDFSNQGYLIPDELTGDSLALYQEYMTLLFQGYQALLDLDIPKEDARFLLPYSFCSNFYCTLNARELGQLISSMKYGRGKHIPELVNLAQQLEDQLATVFPALLWDINRTPSTGNPETVYPWVFTGERIETLEEASVGGVTLLQAPVQPRQMLQYAVMAANPGANEELDIQKILTSQRPRELEQLTYTFKISNLTLSGITHLVRHRMQSILVPSIESVDHSRCLIPESVRQNAAAKAQYRQTLDKAGALLARVQEDALLRKYGYYFALSGNTMDVMTTMNARELMLFIRLRSCNRAQWEIRSVARGMLPLLRENFPELFDHYGPTCVLTGACPEGRMTCGQIHQVQETFRKKL